MFSPYDYNSGYADQTDPQGGQPAQKRYTTTPNWQDPYNPPNPGDPYYAEWAAANPGIPESAAPAVGPQLNANGNTPYNPAPAPPPSGGGAANIGPAQPPALRSVFDNGSNGNAGAPTYSGPSFNAPGYTPPPAFSYQDFQAPDPSKVLDDPSAQFRYQQGLGAIVNNKAAAGILGTGGSLKDFSDYGQQSASQEYSNVWNRAKDAYTMNRANALDAYNTNYHTQYLDPYQIQDQNAMTAFTGAQHNADQGQYYAQHNYDQGLMYDWNKQLEAYNQWRNNRLDNFDMQYRVLTA